MSPNPVLDAWLTHCRRVIDALLSNRTCFHDATVGHDGDWLWWLILGPPMVAHNIELPRRMSYCALNNSYYGEDKCHTIRGVKSNGTNGSNGSNGSITLVRACNFSNMVFHSLFKNVLWFFPVDGVFFLPTSSVFDFFFAGRFTDECKPPLIWVKFWDMRKILAERSILSRTHPKTNSLM